MQTIFSEIVELKNEADVVHARQTVRRHAAEIGLGIVDQTKIVTAASELGRNTVIYGLGGTMTVEGVSYEGRKGLRLIFEDKGPGIADIDQALKDGFTSGSGMGLGLGGARRLSSSFDIWSQPEQGTRVTIMRWK